MQSSHAAGDGFSFFRNNLTRRANHWQYSIIANAVKRPWPELARASLRAAPSGRHTRERGYPVRRGLSVDHLRLWNTGSSAFADDDSGVWGARLPLIASPGKTPSTASPTRFHRPRNTPPAHDGRWVARRTARPIPRRRPWGRPRRISGGGCARTRSRPRTWCTAPA